MPRLALRIAYDGTAFRGSQRQPDVPTVEGTLLQALAKLGAIQDAENARWQMASRTDAGVSALANVAALDTDFPPEALARALAGATRNVWATGIAPVPSAFNPRHARSRRYRYFLPAAGLDDRRLAEALQSFVGEHDFSSFCRREPGDNPQNRVDAIAIHDRGALVAIDFEGPSFLWNQVRRMVEASRRVAAGELAIEELRSALAGKTADFGVAPPEPLVLLEVDCGLEFQADRDLVAQAASDLSHRMLELALRRETLGAIHDALLEIE